MPTQVRRLEAWKRGRMRSGTSLFLLSAHLVLSPNTGSAQTRSLEFQYTLSGSSELSSRALTPRTGPSSLRIWSGATGGSLLGLVPAMAEGFKQDRKPSIAVYPALGAALGSAILGLTGEDRDRSVEGLLLGAFLSAVPVWLAINEYPERDAWPEMQYEASDQPDLSSGRNPGRSG